MQNGKHAIATDLIGGVGFASTEFHVVRPRNGIIAEWVHAYLRRPTVLRAATAHFTGAVGQQRVPDGFLAALPIPLPPECEQERLTAELACHLHAVHRAKEAAQSQLNAAMQLPSTLLRDLFAGVEAERWPGTRLGDTLRLRKEIVHPRDNPSGPAVFVGLEHLESGSGRRIGAVDVEMSLLTGRKPRFYKSDIVYGYLRPYLNKVWVAEFDGLCSVDQYVYEVNTAQADTDFIAWFMRSPVYLERAPVGSDTGQLPRIRTKEVASVEIHLPDVAEQRRAMTKLRGWIAQMDKARKALEDRLAAIDALPAALLRQAFAGELR